MGPQRYHAFQLLAVVIVALVFFAVYFTVFLIAPVVILLLAYLLLLVGERSKRRAGADAPGMSAIVERERREAAAREAEMQRSSTQP